MGERASSGESRKGKDDEAADPTSAADRARRPADEEAKPGRGEPKNGSGAPSIPPAAPSSARALPDGDSEPVVGAGKGRGKSGSVAPPPARLDDDEPRHPSIPPIPAAG